VSANRGASWTKLNNNLPTVAVHEIAQHPTAGEIVVATHGRSLWVLDVTPLREMTTEALKEKAHLYRPNAVVRWHMEQGRGGQFSESQRRFIGQNPPRGAQLYYALGDKADKVTLKVLDYAGKTVADFPAASGEPGLHRIAWNLTTGTQRTGPAGEGGRRRGGRGAPEASGPPAAGSRQAGRQPPSAAGQPSAGARPAGTEAQRPAALEETEQEPAFEMMMFGGRQNLVNPGMYRLVLTVDGKELSQPIKVEPDPTHPYPIAASDGDGDEDEDRDP